MTIEVLRQELSEPQKSHLASLVENSRKIYLFQNLQAQELHEMFLELSLSLTREGKQSLTELYVEKAAGVDRKQGNWLDQVGMNLNASGKTPSHENYRSFWQGINEMLPRFLSEQQLQFLLENDISGDAAFHLFYETTSEFAPNVPSIARDVHAYIHIWK